MLRSAGVPGIAGAGAAEETPVTTRRTTLVMALGAVAALGACRNAPILQETSADFVGRASLAQRADQIRAAGASLGWRMESRGPGLMRGTLDLRSHQAVVDIPYDPQHFRIRYVSSTNLNYDGTTIHRNFNSWVQNLQAAIVTQSANLPRADLRR
jgi:hypothetical protein